MHSTPFFSVVIPTYNCLDLLKRALESVFSQTYQDFEIIVIDNSSNDETQNFLFNIDDSRIQTIIVQNNGVIAHSRNKGIENAKGSWIAFLDSDDTWKPEKLHTVTEVIGQNSDTILFCHDEWLVHKGKMQNRLKYGPSSSDIYERLLFKGTFLSTSAVILRKDAAVISGGFSEREDFALAEDYEYWIRLSQLGKFHFIEKVLGEFHSHEDNNGKDFKKVADATMSVKKHHLDLWLKKFPHGKKQVKIGLSKTFYAAARTLQKGSLFEKSKEYSIKALQLHPFQLKAWIVLLLSFLRIGSKNI